MQYSARLALALCHASSRGALVTSQDESFIGAQVPWGVGIVGHVALTLKSLNIPNAYEDPRFDPEADQRNNFKTRSILTVPVTDRDGKALAVIQVCVCVRLLSAGAGATFLTGCCCAGREQSDRWNLLARRRHQSRVCCVFFSFPAVAVHFFVFVLVCFFRFSFSFFVFSFLILYATNCFSRVVRPRILSRSLSDR